MNVMVVDDSVVFRSQLKACLEGETSIRSVSSAANGKIALDKLSQQPCDLIILDLEMPEMNGMQFLAEFKRRQLKQKVIVFASNTRDGPNLVLEALNAGANDFIAKPKNVNSLDEALNSIRSDLMPKIVQFQKTHSQAKEGIPNAPPIQNTREPIKLTTSFSKIQLLSFRPQIVVIGSSTGGPAALEKIITGLFGHKIHVPILIAQHMPPSFTEALAKRLQSASGIPASEGKDGELIVPGHIYVAPGDYHMRIKRQGSGAPIIAIDQEMKHKGVRPAVDFLFESAAREFGNSCAGFVLTGMGDDGKAGSIEIKKSGGAIMIQNQESSVVWGMPGSVHASGAFDAEGDLSECAGILLNMASSQPRPR